MSGQITRAQHLTHARHEPVSTAVLPHICQRCRPRQHVRRRALQVFARQTYTQHSDTYVIVDPNPGYHAEVAQQQQRLG